MIQSGEIIDVQQMEATGDAAKSYTGATYLYNNPTTTNIQTDVMQLWLTPEVDCWWECCLHVGYMGIGEASWNYNYINLQLAPATTMQGQQYTIQRAIGQRHASATYSWGEVDMVWSLSAGVSYRTFGGMEPASGTHTPWKAPEFIWLYGIAYAK